MTNLQLDEAEAARPTNLLTYTVEVAPYPLNTRVTLRAILANLTTRLAPG